LRYVNRVKGKDGVERLYFRKAGLPPVKLSAAWGTPELEAEVNRLLVGVAAKPQPQTLRAALRAYELDSPDFAALEESTKYLYRKTMQELDEDMGELMVGRFTGPFLLELRNSWATRGYRAAAIRLQVLKNALWPAIVAGKLGGGDPFALIPGVRRPRDAGEPHMIWPESVVHAVIAGALRAGKPGLARGVAIGRYAGPRREDIVRLTRAARKGGRFAFLTGKRHVQVDMPEDLALTTVLDQTPAGEGMLLVSNLAGLAYTADGFALELKKLVGKLHKGDPKSPNMWPGKEIPSDGYDIHGLRHTFGVEAALAGCTDAEGAALMGHGSPASFAIYRRQADRMRLSTSGAEKIAQLRERTPNGSLQNELQNICKTEPEVAAKPRGKNAVKSRR
jgi:hypothetical protein